jgi:hypothetical protein
MRKPGVGFEYQGRRLVGITDHLRRNYFPHFQATRKSTQSKFRGLGLRMGSVADSAVTAYAKTGNFRKMAHSPAAHRLVTFLHRQGLDIVDAHVLVCDPGLGVATEIDVLTQGPRGLVVVENKTTLQCRAEHERTYKKPDRECPLMLRGYTSLLNNEYNHHQLQLAYMILMLKNTYNIDAGGLVLVASSDGLNHYPMNPAILALAQNVVGNQVLFAPLPSNSVHPLLSYRFRAYLPKLAPFSVDAVVNPMNLPNMQVAQMHKTLHKILKRFTFSKMDTNVLMGQVSFYERPDLVLNVTANLVLTSAGDETSPTHLLLIRQLPENPKSLAFPVSTIKLPSGHKHTLLHAHMLELALLVLACKDIKGDISAHILYMDGDSREAACEIQEKHETAKPRKPILRSLQKAFLKAVKT